MKKTILLLTILSNNVYVFAQLVWTLYPGHSKIGFTVTHHMISEVDGYFKNAYHVGERLPLVSVSDDMELRILGKFDKSY